MNSSARFKAPGKLSLVAASAIMMLAATSAMSQVKEAYAVYEGGPEWLPNGAEFSKGVSAFNAGGGKSSYGPAASVGVSFKGVSQYDLRAILGGSFIPPDTHGAIGATQFMETTNGVYGIYSKAGATLAKLDARTFWANAGMTDGSGLNGDARVMYDKPTNRWIALQFGKSVADIQIAVSNTSDAMGGWKSTKFTGFAGGTADYPTLAIDSQAIYIGTNNFNSSNAYAGTTLNVIARSDLLGAAAPTTTSLKQFVTPFTGGPGDVDRGFAIQGVNSTGPNAGRIIAASAFANDTLRYNIANPGTAGATQGAITSLGTTNYANANGAGRQPDGTRNIDTLDQRIGASAWEHNGKIYSVYTATDIGSTHTAVRYLVTDAATNAKIQQGAIGDATHDYYQGSLTINSAGQVVIGYNRSGFQTEDLNGDGLADGNVSFMARSFNSDGTGALTETGELLLHVSPIGNYHNGSGEGAAAVGRQRWGDYSAVTLDPTNDQSFWATGEYAEVWNNAAGCGAANPAIPGCTLSGGSSWGTWISEITLAPAVPEPETYAMMLVGLFAMGGLVRRRKATAA